jgi:methionyl-tRNA synthetase
MLMALDLPLPKQVFGHGWLVIDGGKISKSLGNYKDPREYIDAYGKDAVRYFVLREVPFGSDGNFSESALINRTNGDLANVLGNLVNRTISMNKKYFDNEVVRSDIKTEYDDDLINLVMSTKDKVDKYMDSLKVPEAIDSIMDIFKRCNKYIDETTPWIVAKDENRKDELKTIMYNLLESIRIGAILLSPYLPDTSKEIFRQLNTDKTTIDTISEFGGLVVGNKTNDNQPLFKRIEITEE